MQQYNCCELDCKSSYTGYKTWNSVYSRLSANFNKEKYSSVNTVDNISDKFKVPLKGNSLTE